MADFFGNIPIQDNQDNKTTSESHKQRKHPQTQERVAHAGEGPSVSESEKKATTPRSSHSEKASSLGEKNDIFKNSEQKSHDTQLSLRPRTSRFLPKKQSSFFSYKTLLPALLILLAGAFALSTLFVPSYLKNSFPAALQEATGLQLDADEYRFNPLTCTIHADRLQLSAPDQNGTFIPLLQAEHLSLNLKLLPLLHHTLIAEDLDLQGGTATLIRYPDGKFNISGLQDIFFKPASNSQDSQESSFKYSINNIRVTNSSLLFNDTLTHKQHKAEEISLQVPSFANISTSVHPLVKPSFSAIINGSPISLLSDSSENDKQGNPDLSYTVEGMDIALYADYLPFTLPLDIKQGKADGNITLHFTGKTDEKKNLTLTFDLILHDTQFASKDENARLTIPQVSLAGDLQPFSGSLLLHQLIFKTPQLHLSNNFSKKTWQMFMSAPQEGTTPSGKPSLTAYPEFSVDKFLLQDGQIAREKGKETETYSAIQANIERTAPEGQDGNSAKITTFSLQMEAPEQFGDVSWQGKIDTTGAHGALELQNGKLASLTTFIARGKKQKAIDNEGDVDLKGELNLSHEGNTLKYSLTDAEIFLDKVTCKEQGKTWFSSPSVHITSRSISSNTLSLQDIIVENGTLSLTRTQTPSFLTALQKERKTTIEGLDYKGAFSLSSSDRNAAPLLFSMAHLQLKTSTSKAQDNFTLQAMSNDKNATVQAHGHLSLLPLQGKMELTFTKLTAAPLVTAYFDDTATISSDALISGEGTLDIAQPLFTGTLRLDNWNHKEKDQEQHYDSLLLKDCEINAKEQRVRAAHISVTGYSTSINKTHTTIKNLEISGFTNDKHALAINTIETSDVSLRSENSLFSTLTSLAAEKKLAVQNVALSGDFQLPSATAATPQQGTFQFSLKALPAENPDTSDSTETNNTATENNHLTLTMALSSGGKLEASGDLKTGPLTGKADISLHDMPVPTAFSLLNDKDQQPVSEIMKNSTVNGTVTMSFPKDTLSGDLEIIPSQAAATPATDNLSWQKLSLSNFNYQREAKILNAEKITLEKPQIAIAVAEESTVPTALYKTLQRQIITSNDPATDKGKKKTAFLSQLTISETDILQGTLHIHDQRLQPIHDEDITAVNGKIFNFHSNPLETPMTFSGQGNMEDGSISFSGLLQTGKKDTPLLQAKLTTLDVTDYPLTSYAPQLHSLFTLPEEQFKNAHIDLSFQAAAEKGSPHANLHITFPQKEMETSAMPYFLRLLLDQDNSIVEDMELPETKLPLFLQFTNYFQRMQVKGMVAPSLLLPAALSSILTNSTLAVTPGETTLNDSNKNDLKQLATLLRQRPALQLHLAAVVNPREDRRVLTQELEKKEQQRVAEENKKREEEWKKRNASTAAPRPSTNGQIIVKDIPTEQLQQYTPLLPAAQYATDAMLTALGKERLRVLVSYCQSALAIDPHHFVLDDTVQMIDDLDSPRIIMGLEKAEDTP